MSIGMCRGLAGEGLASKPGGKAGCAHVDGRLVEINAVGLVVAEGGVGGQFCSSGDGGSRCEEWNRVMEWSGTETCLVEVLRPNLAMIISQTDERVEVDEEIALKKASSKKENSQHLANKASRQQHMGETAARLAIGHLLISKEMMVWLCGGVRRRPVQRLTSLFGTGDGLDGNMDNGQCSNIRGKRQSAEATHR